MENATKALLIAAAVLIAILLISLGVGVFNTASEQMGNADLTEYEVKKFNQKFANFEGTNKSGADVNSLIQTVFTHNNAQTDKSTCVVLNGGKLFSTITSSNKLTNMPSKVSTGARYKIECTYSGKTGLITTITVTKES